MTFFILFFLCGTNGLPKLMSLQNSIEMRSCVGYPVTELFSRILMQWSKFFACVLVTGGKYGIILAVLVIQCLWDKPDSVPLIQTPIPFFPLSLSLLFKEIFKRCQETKKNTNPLLFPSSWLFCRSWAETVLPICWRSHFSSHKCYCDNSFQ